MLSLSEFLQFPRKVWFQKCKKYALLLFYLQVVKTKDFFSKIDTFETCFGHASVLILDCSLLQQPSRLFLNQ